MIRYQEYVILPLETLSIIFSTEPLAYFPLFYSYHPSHALIDSSSIFLVCQACIILAPASNEQFSRHNFSSTHLNHSVFIARIRCKEVFSVRHVRGVQNATDISVYAHRRRIDARLIGRDTARRVKLAQRPDDTRRVEEMRRRVFVLLGQFSCGWRGDVVRGVTTLCIGHGSGGWDKDCAVGHTRESVFGDVFT